jgi:DNA (cytosine-5)-methyltransferase 1
VIAWSTFSGIGGLDEGLRRGGIQHALFCEKDPWRRRVLELHFPGVPVLSDVREVGRASVVAGPALLAGGFPCTDLSVAGKRAGLVEGDESGLFFEFARIAGDVRPAWVLIENVPGLFSSQGGRDFGCLLGTLADLGYGVAWRTLDSRFFGVPQRRRRVFILGALAGGDRRAAAERAGEVLAIGASCPRHPSTSRGEGKEVAAVLAGGPDVSSSVAGTLGSLADGGFRTTDVDVIGAYAVQAPDLAATLTKGSNPNSRPAGRRDEDDRNLVVAVSENQRAEVLETPYARQLTTGGGKPGQGYATVRQGRIVRRLMPVEYERLQGLPDGWTAIGPDTSRYAAIGDAVTVNVAQWIAERLIAACVPSASTGDGKAAGSS